MVFVATITLEIATLDLFDADEMVTDILEKGLTRNHKSAKLTSVKIDKKEIKYEKMP